MNLRSNTARSYDGVIIGGSIGGLAAAGYLARSGARVLLVERNDHIGGRAETVDLGQGFRVPASADDGSPFDLRVVRDLHLSQHGLRRDKADMTLVALRPGGKPIFLSPRTLSPARSDSHGGTAYLAFRREVVGWVRLLHRVWDGTLDLRAGPGGETSLETIARRLPLSDTDWERLQDLSQVSAAGFLSRWFEDDALKAALSLEVFPSGLCPEEAGSALVLVWRYGQASAPRLASGTRVVGGASEFAGALEAAARATGAELRKNACVMRIIVENKRAVGVLLASGEIISASAVLSGLDARHTLLELMPPEKVGFGAVASLPDYQRVATAQLSLGLSGMPPFAGLDTRDPQSRIVIAERSEIAAEAKSAAMLGRLPDELIMEISIPSLADANLAPAGGHVMVARLPYMPVAVEAGWQANGETLKRRTFAALERFAPGLRDRVVTQWMMTPDDIAACYAGHAGELGSPLPRFLASYESRIRTPIAGLYLCGAAAEPVSNLSGRAARLAAGLVFADWAAQKGGRT